MKLNRELEWVMDDDTAAYLETFIHEQHLYDALQKIRGTFLKRLLEKIAGVIKYQNKKDFSCIRTLRVSRISNAYPGICWWHVRYSHVPAIRLQGRWLEKLGFKEGQLVQVIACKGFLMVIPSQNKPPST